MNWIKEHLFQAVLTLISGVILFFLGVWYNSYQNKTQYLDYVEVKSEGILKNVTTNSQDSIHFSIDGKPVKDISQLDIEFINHSSITIENTQVIITFEQPPDWETLSDDYFDENGAKDFVKRSELSTSKKVRYGYNVEVMHKKERLPVLTLKYLIKGKVIPPFTISINSKSKLDVEIRKYDIKNEQLIGEEFKEIESILFPIVITILLVIYTTISSRKREDVLKKKIEILRKNQPSPPKVEF